MPSEAALLRDLALAYWKGADMPCPRHVGVKMTGTFVQTTFADHIVLTCPRGKETITIPQRPKQIEFQAQQVEGFLENLQRGDSILCYRCQSEIEVESATDAATGASTYTFTCIRCFSWGRWSSDGQQVASGQ